MLPRPRVLPRHLQRLMPLETCRLIEAYPGYFSKMGFPDFPKSRPNRDRGQIPDYFPDPGAIGIIGKIPAFPAKSGQDRAGWGISGSESGSGPQGRRLRPRPRAGAGGDSSFNLKSGVWRVSGAGPSCMPQTPARPAGPVRSRPVSGATLALRCIMLSGAIKL
jgi:hypothetical protein